ncbi:hypothetical protein [Ruegeria arenilitoris]|uniref:hypothetical protein n=1 Tax=Ruegeria arenilitoris TaxID=1173585 RepID=UPI00147D1149|nr:hypothetical protein [Ruegeria arenilitoris]
MDAVERPNFWRFGNPIMWACITTMGFVALIVWFGLAPTCNGDLFPKGDCPPKWRHLYAAPPNEVGDTLAGLAGVLAFIWLIATVLLQSVELGEQRRVLALQKEEMEEQRKATQDMAAAMGVQSQIFEDEKLYRNEARSHQLLLAKVDALRRISRSIVDWNSLEIEFSEDNDIYDLCRELDSAKELADVSEGLLNFFSFLPDRISLLSIDDWMETKTYFYEQAESVTKVASEILLLDQSLSLADRQLVTNMNLGTLIKCTQNVTLKYSRFKEEHVRPKL